MRKISSVISYCFVAVLFNIATANESTKFEARTVNGTHYRPPSFVRFHKYATIHITVENSSDPTINCSVTSNVAIKTISLLFNNGSHIQTVDRFIFNDTSESTDTTVVFNISQLTDEKGDFICAADKWSRAMRWNLKDLGVEVLKEFPGDKSSNDKKDESGADQFQIICGAIGGVVTSITALLVGVGAVYKIYFSKENPATEDKKETNIQGTELTSVSSITESKNTSVDESEIKTKPVLQEQIETQKHEIEKLKELVTSAVHQESQDVKQN